jgi:hypothetical protein
VHDDGPTLVCEPFYRHGWVYEEKIDGWRMLAAPAYQQLRSRFDWLREPDADAGHAAALHGIRRVSTHDRRDLTGATAS